MLEDESALPFTVDKLNLFLCDMLRTRWKEWSGFVVLEENKVLFKFNLKTQKSISKIDVEGASRAYTPDVWGLQDGNYIVECDTSPRFRYYTNSDTTLNTIDGSWKCLIELQNRNIVFYTQISSITQFVS
jgi:hypothetical protein